MKTNTTKSKYVKPSITAVEWDFNESVCQQIVTASPCIVIKGDDTGANTRIDHRGSYGENSITWENWNRSGSR